MSRKRTIAGVILAGLIAWAAISVAGDASPSHQAAATEPFLQLGVAHPAEHYPPVGTKPIVFLVLGDSTGRTTEESRISDAIHLVGFNPEQNRASILNFPRDLWVPIPGHGTTKINAATEYGGADLMIQTIEDLSGIHIDYYAETGFSTFRTIVSDLGGVIVPVPYPIDDSHTGFNAPKGKMDMSGKMALDFVRSRYGVPNGDFSRTENQGIFLTAMLTKLRKQFASNPNAVLDWIGAGLRNTENDIPLDQLMAFSFAAGQVPSKNVNNTVVPGTIGNAGGQSIVNLAPAADQVFADFAKDGLIGKK